MQPLPADECTVYGMYGTSACLAAMFVLYNSYVLWYLLADFGLRFEIYIL